MPDPASYADEDEFMAACVPQLMDEGREQDQAVAACLNMWRERSAAPATVSRAYSLLTVKALDGEQRLIEGTATTPTVDRIGDVVEPLGAPFTLPMPLLWHERHMELLARVLELELAAVRHGDDRGLPDELVLPRDDPDAHDPVLALLGAGEAA